MTVYVFRIVSGMSKVKPIYDHSRNCLLDWFPQLPGYQAFNYRLNELSSCFEVLVCSLKAMPCYMIPPCCNTVVKRSLIPFLL